MHKESISVISGSESSAFMSRNKGLVVPMFRKFVSEMNILSKFETQDEVRKS